MEAAAGENRLNQDRANTFLGHMLTYYSYTARLCALNMALDQLGPAQRRPG